MIKILKWELLKELNILKWIITPFLIFLLILLIIPVRIKIETDGGYDIFLNFSNFIVSLVPTFFILFYPSISLVLELRQSYSVLEKSLPQPFIKILSARIITNILVFLVGSILAFLGTKIMNRFWIVQRLDQFNLYILLCTAIFYPLIIHFFYLLTSNFSPIMGTIFLTVLFIKITTGLYFLPYIILVPSQIIISVIAFVGSCLLYEKKYIPK